MRGGGEGGEGGEFAPRIAYLLMIVWLLPCALYLFYICLVNLCDLLVCIPVPILSGPANTKI